MKNEIIFPFDYNKDNREMFVRTLQIAQLTNANVVLFTTVREDALGGEMKKVYNHFFELNGFFQTFFNKWKKIIPPPKRVILRGNLSEKLVEYIRELKYPVKVVVTQSSKEMNKESLEELFRKLVVPPNLIK